MDHHARPFLGSTQPGTGSKVPVVFSLMGRRSKRDKPMPLIRQTVADNIATLRDIKYASIPTLTGRNRKLAKDADTSLSQIQRILSRDVGVSIDMLEPIAAVFQASPADLITPYFATTRLYRSVQEAPRSGLQRSTG